MNVPTLALLLFYVLSAVLVHLSQSQTALKDMEFKMCCTAHKFERNVTKHCSYDLLYRLFTIKGGNTPRNDVFEVPHPFSRRYTEKEKAKVIEPFYQCLTKGDSVMDCCEANKMIKRECFVWCKPGMKTFYDESNKCHPDEKKNFFSIGAAIYCHYFHVKNNLIGRG